MHDNFRRLNKNPWLNLCLPNGHICEVQLNLTLMLRVKQDVHIAYEQIRSSLPALCPGTSFGQLEKVQHVILSVLDGPGLHDGYFGTLRTVRAAGLSARGGRIAHYRLTAVLVDSIQEIESELVYENPGTAESS